MLCPEFSIQQMDTYGIHLDPRTHSPSRAALKDTISSFYRFCFFLEDWEGGVVIDGHFYLAAAGHFACCKPMQPMHIKPPFRNFNLIISTTDPTLIEGLDQLPNYSYHPEMDTILALLNRMYFQIPTRTALPDRMELLSCASNILYKLLRGQYPLEQTRERNVRRHQEVLLAANQYLKEHIEEDVDLEKLAKDSFLHPTYFHKLFKAAFGRTPAQQLMLYRIRASRDYLRKDDCTIAEISRKCGFSSQSYYCRKYKELSLQTPSQFRNSIRRRRKRDTPKE